MKKNKTQGFEISNCNAAGVNLLDFSQITMNIQLEHEKKT